MPGLLNGGSSPSIAIAFLAISEMGLQMLITSKGFS
jgi:hypothetical protein